MQCHQHADLYIRHSMQKISDYSTKDLLQLTIGGENKDIRYDASQALFKRWRSGVDLALLIDFIVTEVVSDRRLGAYFLFEVSPSTESVRNAVLNLADDFLPECRRAFVGYLINTRFYDETAAKGLVKCIKDFDIQVRLRAIDWAIATNEELFEDFSRRVMAESRIPSSNRWRERLKQRDIRALAIARRVRSGESVAQIREVIRDEDGFTFDHLSVFHPDREPPQER